MSPLEKFALAVLEASRSELGDLEEGWLQGMAEAHGLLVRYEATAPCGEGCSCEDFPMDCRRYAPDVQAALDAAEAVGAAIDAAIKAEDKVKDAL